MSNRQPPLLRKKKPVHFLKSAHDTLTQFGGPSSFLTFWWRGKMRTRSIHVRTMSMLSLLILAQCLLGGTSFEAQRDCMTRRQRTLPIPLGVSGSNVDSISQSSCCSGTLGSLVQDTGGNQYILSNSHVLVTGDNSQA